MPATAPLATLARFALATTLAAALTAQSTGRTISTIAPANLGSAAQFRVNYPNTDAGNFGWFLMAGHQAGTVPVPIPGFTVYGSCRVDPAVLFQTYFFLMDITGASTLSLQVPNSITFWGFQFDVQSLDANLFTGDLSWGDNDAEVVVGPGPQLPVATANMVPIPAGSFAMGSSSPSGSPYFPQANERPVHTVTISRPFWMGRYEVTQSEYQAVMGANPSFHQGASYPNSGNRPVEQVSYDQAMIYCAQLTSSEREAGRLPQGWAYRLPTEAEWEYACRAGTTTEFAAGTSLSCAVANYSTCVGQTATVGSYAANAFGLYDMCGNVAEWCLDAWDGSANYPAAAATDPYVSTGTTRIVRGGALGNQSYACRSATRSGLAPTATTVSCGFRVVLAPVLGPIVAPLPNFVPIPGGTFQMGSTAGNANEQPVHQVTISQPFWMAKCEVTQAEYQAAMGGNPSSVPSMNHPVDTVPWSSAMAYCAALTTSERAAGRMPAGYQYRLPTEAEWEYCCRAGTTTEWNTGTSISTSQANFSNSSPAQPVNVGSYAANAFGLFDMHGNIMEWCLDAWDGSNNYPSSAVSDPYVSSGSIRVVRGGNWASSSLQCRSSARFSWSTMFGSISSIGFRVVLAPVLVP